MDLSVHRSGRVGLPGGKQNPKDLKGGSWDCSFAGCLGPRKSKPHKILLGRVFTRLEQVNGCLIVVSVVMFVVSENEYSR